MLLKTHNFHAKKYLQLRHGDVIHRKPIIIFVEFVTN